MVRPSHRQSTLTRQTILLLLISILPILGISTGINYLFARDTLETQAKIEFAARTAALEEPFNAAILRTWDRMALLAQNPNLADGIQPPAETDARAAAEQVYEAAAPSAPERQRYVKVGANGALLGFNSQYPMQWDIMLTTDGQGALRSTNDPAWPYWNLAAQPWWKALVLGGELGPGISFATTVPNVGPLVLFSAPIHASNFRSDGFVIVGARPAVFIDPIFSRDRDALTTLMLARSDGEVIYATPPWSAARLPTAWQVVGSDAKTGAAIVEDTLIGYAPIQIAYNFLLDPQQTLDTFHRLGWVILRITPLDHAFAPLQAQLIGWVLGGAATTTMVVVIAATNIRWRIARPLGILTSAMSEIRRHGITHQNVSPLVGRLPVAQNEIGTLSQIFGQMLQELANLLWTQEETAGSLRAAAVQLSHTAEEQLRISQHTNQAVGAVLQAFQALDAAALAIAEHAVQVAGQATELRSQQQTGARALLTTQEVLTHLQASARTLETVVQTLRDEATDAGMLITQVHNVADTTHVLSLNALIEASGAGLQGARFGVIAKEVRSLAVAAATTATSIESTIMRMNEETLATATESTQTRTAIDQGVAQLTVLEAIMQVLDQASNELAANAQGIRQRSEDQRTRSQQVHATSEHLATTMQQLTIASNQLAAQAHTLLELAATLDSRSRL